MKTYFEEPIMEVIRFSVEDAITVSGMRGIEGGFGFDETESNKVGYAIPALEPPCL